MSTITLHRIRDKIDHFTGPYQSGFKRGRSCADIVWAQRMLVSVVMTKHWDFHKMGIDMSRAFDTIKRSKILHVLQEAGCVKDDLRLVRLLLADTKLRVRIKTVHSAEFETSLGSPQGDLSPVLFTCYLAAALSSIREHSSRPNLPALSLGMPLEMEYADDVDFIDEGKKHSEQLTPPSCRPTERCKLVYEPNQDGVHPCLSIADTQETDEQGLSLRGDEEWRKSKLLGSLLCSSSDIARCNMGNNAFHSFWKILIRGSRLPLAKNTAYTMPLVCP